MSLRMSTKDIRPSDNHTVCDVCGRTLLRGERAEVYINGGGRREVCELCKPRVLQEGWVREGTLPAYDQRQTGTERRRSLLGRWRSRREASGRSDRSAPTLDDELAGDVWSEPAPAAPAPVPAAAARPREDHLGRVREPRHVRAVPSSDDQKIMAAVDLFNQSEHRRTVVGVARSLGAPVVSVLPAPERPSLVHIVVSWELCWYRYVVDLSDEVLGVRVDGQGYELTELTEPERLPNAVSDEVGELTFTG